MIQICSLQKGTISTFIIKDRQKREALMWPDELQSFRIAEKTSRNLSSPDLVEVRDRAVAIKKTKKRRQLFEARAENLTVAVP